MGEYKPSVMQQARGLIDSEYEQLEGMTVDDLWDYLISDGLIISRQDAEQLHLEFGF